MPLTSYFREKYALQQGDFPVTDSIAKRALSLPLYENLSTANQEVVVKNLLG